MMRDIGNDETEVLLAEIEKKIGMEYKRAAEDIEAKLADYWRRFQIKDEAWQRMVANGTKTKQQYQAWRTGQLMVGDRWEGMKKTIANDLHNANTIAKGIVNGNLAEVYAANHNFTTFDIEKAARVNTSYTLYDKDTVARILRDNPELLPPPSASLQKEFADFDAYKAGQAVDLSEEKRKAFDKLIADNKDIRWQEGKLQSVTLQSILQGESIPNMAKRIAQELGEINHKSTIRYARTAVTGAQNAGKEDAYRRAEAHGCKMKRVWRAVHDNRTRHEHRVLDGQIRGIDEPFEIDGYKIDFPADPKLAREAPYLYWNCRCYTRALIDGLEPQAVKYRPETIDGMTYDEWKNAKPKSRSITHQEEVAETMRRRTIRELYGGTLDGETENNTPITKSKTIEEANKKATGVLENAYENHRIKNNTNSVPVADFKEGLRPIHANYNNMTAESADKFTDTIASLSSKYDTQLSQIRTMTQDEARLRKNTFAFVHTDYTTDTATLVINPVKCKNSGSLAEIINERARSGYCARIKPELADQYVATHEFAHSVLNMSNPLNDKTNWVGANYSSVRKARSEITQIFDRYMKDVGQLTKKAKDLELQAILATDADEMKRLGGLASAARQSLVGAKISEYSMTSIDDFVAESFANETIGIASNPYAAEVMQVITKYFGR